MTDSYCMLCQSNHNELKMIHWKNQTICSACFQTMLRQKWEIHRTRIENDGLFAILIHSMVLLFVILVLHANWRFVIFYEMILVFFHVAKTIRTLPTDASGSKWRLVMIWMASGVPWVISIWISKVIESLRYRSVLNQKIPLSHTKVSPSFYSSYQSTISNQFLHTALLQSIDIEFLGKRISARNYGTIVYDNELYAVFIPERENTLYIARLDREQETLVVPSKEIYHVLFDALQKEK